MDGASVALDPAGDRVAAQHKDPPVRGHIDAARNVLLPQGHSEVIGVDLGTRNTVIYSATRREIVFNEPTSLALDRATKQIREIGFLADEIQGKAPYSYQIVYPVRNGLIQDVDLCFEFLSRALESLDLGRRNFSIVFIAPSRTSKVNREALQR